MTLRWDSNSARVSDRALFHGRVENGQLSIAPDPKVDRFVGVHLSGPATPSGIAVSSESELNAAIQRASAGDVFLLAAGQYVARVDPALGLKFHAQKGAGALSVEVVA